MPEGNQCLVLYYINVYIFVRLHLFCATGSTEIYLCMYLSMPCIYLFMSAYLCIYLCHNMHYQRDYTVQCFKFIFCNSSLQTSSHHRNKECWKLILFKVYVIYTNEMEEVTDIVIEEQPFQVPCLSVFVNTILSEIGLKMVGKIFCSSTINGSINIHNKCFMFHNICM